MDYDRTTLPAGYDRGRDHGPEVLALWMNAVAKYTDAQPRLILDLGCGTGRFTEALAATFDASVVGLDPSTKMLDRAHAKRRDSRVHYQLGRAEEIPLATDAVDLIFNSMTYHHFADPLAAARECRRVLRVGGIMFMRTGTSDRTDKYPYVPFFPSTPSLLRAALPTCASIRSAFEAAGFRTITTEIITQTISPNWAAYAEKLAAGADSVLARLPQAELDTGIERARTHVVPGLDQSVTEPIDVLVFA